MRSLKFGRAVPLYAALFAGLIVAASASAQQGLGESFTGLQINGDQPISIESNQLDVDDNKAVATFTGNVQVSQGETELRTGKLVVSYTKAQEGASGGKTGTSALPGGSSQIERLEASEKVYVKSADQVATAEKATFDMKSEVVVMTGNVVLSQGQNVAEGCRLTIQMQTGLARLESTNCGDGDSGGSGGRVRMMLTPDQ
ncbi:lipopolysaccharide transport periplasmic protein LptA [Aurantimonas sp. C2-6-R+9]|uniref:lipopolysaccharide transport periplasmic protein LptA n=1 Tax=unclassified Aurantimonas TaxID=2638230 RepID=UPI002E19B90E|nr:MULTISPECIES: lipopolysaccharide transport periplasmic protein LptA [unclassified Aurantimonas]MEC5289535.1 lipopolysaccharide transport periplasmic protein LptA [Aurantimonas sp. C2-3-R2]MEC5379500.1 lipopolysaccharide transport periplasmic protein LptA [Aurantimonas sp. C2-6-R+9]MEC5410616.1 lipopolysaccharide transport periplasmic protein LptA [Aurantimonas sp. C2-4-R8]